MGDEKLMARPRKYKTQQQRKAANKVSRTPQLKSRYFRLVIPNLIDFTSSQDLLQLKGDTLNLLQTRQFDLQHYKIAVQTHPTTGVPHLDILLLYSKSVQKSVNRFDYLVKHGHLSRYKKLNQAILSYGDKQDKHPLTNMPRQVANLLRIKQLRAQPHVILRQAMLADPFHFEPISWLKQQGLIADLYRSPWQKALALLKRQQPVQCNKILCNKPGFRLITRQLIRQVLTSRQYTLFRKNRTTFDKIITKINEITIHGCHRFHKTKNLLLVGPPDTGKTSLALQIEKHTSVYYMGVHNWFPTYRSGVYKMILWNQFNLRSMSYPQLLNFLEGTKMDLQYKGGSTLKTDNQLVFMTSNMTLTQHINHRFSSPQSRALAQLNLRARIQQVVLPPGVDLFILQKLITSV